MSKKPHTTKWITGVEPHDSVPTAASRALATRLRDVRQALPLAAQKASQDTEYVHQLRVLSRRSMAAVRLYEDYLPRRRRKWLKKRLKKTRSAAGAARDLDVLIEKHRFEDDPVGRKILKSVRKRRKSAQKPITRIYKNLDKGKRLQRVTRRILKKLSESQDTQSARSISFQEWALNRLEQSARQFFEAEPENRTQLSELHQFRIQAKRLRYSIELLAPAFGPELRNEVYPKIEELQERLGDINDHRSAISAFAKWKKDFHGAEANYLERYIQEERTQLEEKLRAFEDWWTDDRKRDLHNAVDRILGNETKPEIASVDEIPPDRIAPEEPHESTERQTVDEFNEPPDSESKMNGA